MRVLDSSIPIAVEEDRRPGSRNSYVGLSCIQALASLAASFPQTRDVLSSFVGAHSAREGYTKKDIRPVRLAAFHLWPEDVLRRSVKALDDLAATYESIIADDTVSEGEKAELPGRFTSAITEAVTLACLIKAGREEVQITCDARVLWTNDDPVNSANIDHVWAARDQMRAEALECKHTPMRLLGPYPTRKAPGNWAKYEQKSQLYLMLKFRELLEGAEWNVLVGCVTLRTGYVVHRALQSLSEFPERFEVYTAEDFGKRFPPPLQN